MNFSEYDTSSTHDTIAKRDICVSDYTVKLLYNGT